MPLSWNNIAENENYILYFYLSLSEVCIVILLAVLHNFQISVAVGNTVVLSFTYHNSFYRV